MPSTYGLGDFLAGETITATVTTVGGTGTTELQAPWGSSQDSGAVGGAPVVLTYTLTANASVRLLNTLSVQTTSGSFAFTCTATPDSGSTTSAIPAWLQAYGRGAPDEACPTGYNPSWAGGPSADDLPYGQSWQQWMNNGTGGWVCTRNVPSLG